MPPFTGILYDFQLGEFRQLQVGETFSADSIFMYTVYNEPTLDWKIEHNLGQYLPMILYTLHTAGGTPMFAGVDEARSDSNQTTLHLTEPYAGYLTYQIFDQ